jgi:hypothetical protein
MIRLRLHHVTMTKHWEWGDRYGCRVKKWLRTGTWDAVGWLGLGPWRLFRKSYPLQHLADPVTRRVWRRPYVRW